MKDFPTKDAILEWIQQNPDSAGKRDIARAFGIKGSDRITLKRLLRELEDAGQIVKERRRVHPPGYLPPVTVLVAKAPDPDGDIWAVPKDWEDGLAVPRILYTPRKGDAALAEGDWFLGKLSAADDGEADGRLYHARLIKRLPNRPKRMLGIYRAVAQGGRVLSVDKRDQREWLIPAGASDGAEEGELVEAEATTGPRLGLQRARIVERLGDPGAPKSISLIALHHHGIALEFPDEVIEEAERATPPKPDGLTDLRGVPLITIDPADARDHDDAVAALPDDDPANPGGHVVWVAIADVAWYVRPGSALDREARRRGNSTYFPDRVAPMLPEMLSADLCSLHEGVERPCLAVRMVLDAAGEKIGHRFVRGIMRSPAAVSYGEAQGIADGRVEAAPPIAEAITHLFAAYRAAAAARDRRQPLALNLPERQVELGPTGQVTAVRFRDRLDAHRLIEEFMILANVSAAETLESARQPLLYRVHEEPNPDKLDALAEIVDSVGLPLAKGQVLTTRHLNRLLEQAEDTAGAEMIHLAVLRSQTQAYYADENFGHFGLNLKRYAHFTSPIRRYADLVVHRALIGALRLGEGGQTPDERDLLSVTAEHISRTERVSMEAERDTTDRYLAAYLEDRVGAEFSGQISGVAKFGLFVKLDETGADGLVPMSTLGDEYFRHDQQTQTITGEHSGVVFALGQSVRVRLIEAEAITGGLVMELLSTERAGRRYAPRKRAAGKRGPKRKLTGARLRQAKADRKARRTR